nr:MAG TPA: hypothetical protein [Caudoviricetes sp.]
MIYVHHYAKNKDSFFTENNQCTVKGCNCKGDGY